MIATSRNELAITKAGRLSLKVNWWRLLLFCGSALTWFTPISAAPPVMPEAPPIIKAPTHHGTRGVAPLRSFEVGSIANLCIDDANNRVAYCHRDTTLVVRNLKEGSEIARFPCAPTTLCLAFIDRGTRIAVCEGNGRVRLWDIATNKMVQEWNPDGAIPDRYGIDFLAISGDELTLAIAGTKCQIWKRSQADLATIELPPQFDVSNPPRFITFAPGDDLFALMSAGYVGLYQTWPTKFLRTIRINEDAWAAGMGVFAWSTTSRYFVTGGTRGHVSVFDCNEGRLVSRVRAFTGPVTELALFDSGKKLIALSHQGFPRPNGLVWEVTTGEVLQSFECPPREMISAKVTRDGKLLIMATAKGLDFYEIDKLPKPIP